MKNYDSNKILVRLFDVIKWASLLLTLVVDIPTSAQIIPKSHLKLRQEKGFQKVINYY